MACLFFAAAGFAFLPLLGIEADEALFGSAVYDPHSGVVYSIRLGHFRLPAMLMTYLGALKAWLYAPILQIFGPGLLSLRAPAILAGAAGIWLFFLLLRRLAGTRDAVIGCVLLAVDSMYLLTSVYDWGPVALQHLLVIGGALSLVRFYQTHSHRALAAGFFLWGLALWDKALALWMLSGLGIAALLTFPRQIFAVTTKRRLLISVLAFLLGALPLLLYNVRTRGATFRGSFVLETDFGKKIDMLRHSTDDGLFGFLTMEDWQTPAPHEPRSLLQAASLRISEAAGRPRHHLFSYAFGLALLATPFAGRFARRTVLFALIALAVAWIQMAINANTGGSVHHTVLLWPLPHLIIAVSFAGAAQHLRRAATPVLAAVTGVLAISCLLVMNEYYVSAWRFGGAHVWTDAIQALSDSFKRSAPKRVVCMDWGILEQLQLLHAGKLPLAVGSDMLSRPDVLRKALSDPDHVFVRHTEPYEVFKGNGERLIKLAEESGWRGELIEKIPDSHGRMVFEVFKFVR